MKVPADAAPATDCLSADAVAPPDPLVPPGETARQPPRSSHVDDRGSVTAETAVVLPALVFVLALVTWVLVAVSAQLRCTDAAGLVARAAARGETGAAVLAAARAVAPSAADVQVEERGAYVHVQVRARVRPFGVLQSRLPPVEVAAEAVAAREGSAVAP